MLASIIRVAVTALCLVITLLTCARYAIEKWRKGAFVRLLCRQSEFNISVASRCPSFKKRYFPALWGASCHVQSMALGLLRPPPPVSWERIQLHSELGPFTISTASTADMNDETPCILLLPGITGTSTTAYVQAFAAKCLKCGWRVYAMNHRASGDEPIEHPDWFNIGGTADLHQMVLHCAEQFPNAPRVIVGWSMGSNITVKYLGEMADEVEHWCGNTHVEEDEEEDEVVRDETPLSRHRCPLFIGAVSVCNGYDGAKALIEYPNHARLYNFLITKKLQMMVKKNRSPLSRSTSSINLEAALRSSSMQEFDQHFSCPMLKFNTPEEYYHSQSCARTIHAIRTPTLLVNAVDDPLITPNLFPIAEAEVQRNSHLMLLYNECGGHLGFGEGFLFARKWSWLDRVGSEYIASLLTEFRSRREAACR